MVRAALAALAGLAGVGAIVASPFGNGDNQKQALSLLHPRSPYSQQSVVVNVFEYGFQPSRLVIRTGQVVAWRDVGKEFHVVTPSTAAGRRVFKAAKTAASSSHLFSRPGRYPYHCALHPRMRGIVIVRRRA